MTEYISKDDFLAVLNETVNSGLDFTFTPSGNSMKPFLNGTTDTVTLTKKPVKLNKYDVVFFRRESDNALVLHRIVKVTGEREFVVSGDNQYFFENVLYDEIFAVLKSYTKKGKTYSAKTVRFRAFARFILIKKYTRLFLSRVYHKIFK